MLIGLLRGINVGGQKRVPMGELRALAERLGLGDVATYIQSGNLVFSSELAPRALELALEAAIFEHFGFQVPVVVRSARKLSAYVEQNPFLDVAESQPKFLQLGFAKQAVKPNLAQALEPYARYGERIRALDDALWIAFPQGVGTSKLTPSVLDRMAGSSVTLRNYRTVLEVLAMAGH